MLLLEKSKQRHLSEMDFHQEVDDIIRNRCSKMFLKEFFLKKLQYSQENACIGRSLVLIKLMGFRPATLFKRDS